MLSGGLLARLAHLEERAPSAPTAEAVARNLSLLLNTSQGACPIDPLYGLPDLTDLGRGPVAEHAELRRVLEAIIPRYEKRLADLMISPTSGVQAGSVWFVARARVRGGGRARLLLEVRGSGEVRVTAQATG